jgi:pimeloyl-ACP methyl ester carboxylesterase
MKFSRRTSAMAMATASFAAISAPASTSAFIAPTSSLSSATPSQQPLSTLLGATLKGIQEDLTFTPPLDSITNNQISDSACIDAAKQMKRVMVPVSKEVSDTGYVGISFIHWQAEKPKQKSTQYNKVLPILLVHGFDSSSLEYRRLGPKLAALGIDVYCVDLLGWGYTQLGDSSVKSYSAKAKVEALSGFWKVVGNDDEVVVGGASLGGAAVIEFAAENIVRRSISDDDAAAVDRSDIDTTTSSNTSDKGFVRGAVLIDAQGFVDGIGPMSFLPVPLARAGIKVLQSISLRQSANRMSYYDVETYATEDAQKIGRLHCLREGWEDGMLSFMQSGGFRPKEKVAKIDVPTLVLWGRQDGILDGKEFANKFIDTMPNAQLRWIEECGHVPHLEQPEVTAQYIAEFLQSEEVQPSKKSASSPASFAFAGNNILDGLFGFLSPN